MEHGHDAAKRIDRGLRSCRSWQWSGCAGSSSGGCTHPFASPWCRWVAQAHGGILIDLGQS